MDDWCEVVEQDKISYLRYATREYLEDEVYWADGINETDCPHYVDFLSRFKDNWIKKAETEVAEWSVHCCHLLPQTPVGFDVMLSDSQ